MTQFLRRRVIYSIFFYILLASLFYMTKPLLSFGFDGSVKPFGVGVGKTVFSFGTVVTCLSILCFYLFCLIDML